MILDACSHFYFYFTVIVELWTSTFEHAVWRPCKISPCAKRVCQQEHLGISDISISSLIAEASTCVFVHRSIREQEDRRLAADGQSHQDKDKATTTRSAYQARTSRLSTTVNKGSCFSKRLRWLFRTSAMKTRPQSPLNHSMRSTGCFGVHNEERERAK